MHLLNGECPFEAAGANSVNISGLPNVITEQELHDNEFVLTNRKHFNMMLDLTKT